MPQPLSRVAPAASILIDVSQDDPANQRPSLTQAAMQIISQWSILESYITGLFVASLQEGALASAAIFATIRSQAGQRDAIAAAINTTIEDAEMKRAVTAVFSIYTRASGTRNRIAHWIWGVSPNLTDEILLIDPIAIAVYRASLQDWSGGKQPELDKNKVFVYNLQDFEQASDQIKHAIRLAVLTMTALTQIPNPTGYEILRAQLLSEPEILAEMARQNRGRQTAP